MHRRASIATIVVLAATGLAGCAVGPDFLGIDPPAAARGTTDYTPTPVPLLTATAPVPGGGAQRLMPGADLPAQWWTRFRSPALDDLIATALRNNPTLAAVQAALREAEENWLAERGALRYPNIAAQIAAERTRARIATGAMAEYNLFSASVAVSYRVDLFGGNRRVLEGLAAAIDYQRFQLEAACLTLAANVATTAIREASLRAQLQVTQEVLALQRRQLAVVELQFTTGAVARAAVLTQRTQVAQTEAGLPPLEKALAQARQQLSVYVGRLPSEPGMPAFALDSLHLPGDLPVSLPSLLVRQRPDLRASVALVHAASAQIGVATAAQFPQLDLSASYGAGATRIGDLFTGPSALWSLGAGLVQPLFNGGALRARTRAAQAAYDEAQAQYRATVLTAFQNVADVLRAIEFDAQALRTQAEAEALAREALTISTEQYRLGSVSFLQLLDAQRTYQQTRLNLVQAQAARHADTVALFQALGGGWWNGPALADASPLR